LHGVYTVITGKGDQEKDVGIPVRRPHTDLVNFANSFLLV
jgi:hypothetical protein